LQKPAGKLLTAMQANLYELYTITYLVNLLLATIITLNLEMHQCTCNHHII